MKLLIVDDSLISTRRLTALEDWKTIGIKEVLIAHHAIHAKRILKETSVDILICDVELPKENGISLAVWALQTNPGLSLIFLDETLREPVLSEALRLKAEDVFIKPVDTNRLLETVKQIVQQKQLQKNMEDACRVGAYWMARQQFLEDLFWRDAIFRPNDPVLENVQYYADLQQIKFDVHSLYSIILISTEKTELSPTSSPALHDLARDILLEPDTSRRLVPLSDYFIVISEQLNQSELEDSCLQFIQKSQELFPMQSCCYISIGILYSEFHQTSRALRHLKENDIEQRERLVFLSAQEERSDTAPTPDYLFPIGFRHLLYSGEEEKFFKEYHAFLEHRKEQTPLSLSFLKNLQKDLLQCFMIVLEQKELYAHEISDALFRFPAHRLSELEAQIHSFFDQLRQGETVHQRKDTISNMLIRYIDGHLSEPISRESLSKLVGLSPDYMSRIFKQETGIPLKEYIIEARLQKAARLLLTSKKSIAEISGEVGYPNFAYFSKLYKEHFGKPPSEVRRDGLQQEHRN